MHKCPTFLAQISTRTMAENFLAASRILDDHLRPQSRHAADSPSIVWVQRGRGLRLPRLGLPFRNLSQLKIHGYGHNYRHGRPVEHRRCVLPLLDSGNRRVVEQSHRPQHLDIRDPTVDADHCLENNDARRPSSLRDWGVDRVNVPYSVRPSAT